jgi:hypothetical protein
MSEFCTGCGSQLREGDLFCGKCGRTRAAPPEPAARIPVGPAPRHQRSSGGPSKLRFLPVILGMLLPLAIGLFVFTRVGDCGSAEGSVQVTGPRGDFSFAPTGCASMQPWGRFGANLHGDGPNDGAVYVTLDHATGSRVDLEIPGSCRNANGTDCDVFTVPRDRCTLYEALVERTGTTVNDVRLVKGRVRLDCELDDGTVVRGDISFNGC